MNRRSLREPGYIFENFKQNSIHSEFRGIINKSNQIKMDFGSLSCAIANIRKSYFSKPCSVLAGEAHPEVFQPQSPLPLPSHMTTQLSKRKNEYASYAVEGGSRMNRMEILQNEWEKGYASEGCTSLKACPRKADRHPGQLAPYRRSCQYHLGAPQSSIVLQ